MAEVPPVLQVPQGHIWIEGDNWRHSLDSNDFGPISMSLVIGKAEKIIWPWSRFGDIPQRPEKDRSRTVVKPGEPPIDLDGIIHGLTR
jgi:inner membrane protease subunit 2